MRKVIFILISMIPIEVILFFMAILAMAKDVVGW